MSLRESTYWQPEANALPVYWTPLRWTIHGLGMYSITVTA